MNSAPLLFILVGLLSGCVGSVGKENQNAVLVVCDVESYESIIPIEHSTGEPLSYRSVLKIVSPAERQGVEVWIDGTKALGEGDVLHGRGQRVQFRIVDFPGHRSEYFQQEKAHVVYRFRATEIGELTVLKEEPDSG
jgi:hypothetical protein